MDRSNNSSNMIRGIVYMNNMSVFIGLFQLSYIVWTKDIDEPLNIKFFGYIFLSSFCWRFFSIYM